MHRAGARSALGLACLTALLATAAVAAADKNPPPGLSSASWLSVTARDGVAYFGRDDGLVLLDFTDPVSPREIGFLRLRAAVLDVALQDSLAYLAAGSRGLLVVDLSDPAEPTLLQEVHTPGAARRVRVRDEHAFVADHGHGLRVLDLSVADRPVSRALVSSRGELHALELHDDLLAAAEGNEGVRLFDVRKPTTPQRREVLTRADGARDIAFVDDLLLVAAGRQGLLVYHAEPGAPLTLTGQLETRYAARAVVGLGSRRLALLAAGPGGLHVVDAGDPAAPRILASVPLPRSYTPFRVAVDGGLAFIAAEATGFAVVDVKDPANPEVLLPRARSMKVTFR